MPEDDKRLLAAVRRSGRNWKELGEREFVGRSTTDLKNRYDLGRKAGEERAKLTNTCIDMQLSRKDAKQLWQGQRHQEQQHQEHQLPGAGHLLLQK